MPFGSLCLKDVVPGLPWYRFVRILTALAGNNYEDIYKFVQFEDEEVLEYR